MDLSRWLYKISSGWATLIALAIFLAFSVTVLPDQSAKAEEYSQGVGGPDTSLFYSAEDLYNMAEVYGESGRVEFVHARFTFDLAFPAVYGFFLVTAISWIFKQFVGEKSLWRLVNYFPVFAVIFDLLENISTSMVMQAYPVQSPIAVSLAPIFTPIKWFFVGGSFLILVAGLLIFGWQKLKPKS